MNVQMKPCLQGSYKPFNMWQRYRNVRKARALLSSRLLRRNAGMSQLPKASKDPLTHSFVLSESRLVANPVLA